MVSYLFIIAVFILSVDVFLASTVAGFLIKKTDIPQIARLIMSFAIVGGIMLFAGIFIGKFGELLFSKWVGWYAATLLFLLALKLFYDGLRMHKIKQTVNPLDNNGLLALTAMVSINTLFTGISFGLLNINYFYTWYVVLIFAFAVIFGYLAGKKIKKLIAMRVGLFSAVIFLFLAIIVSLKF